MRAAVGQSRAMMSDLNPSDIHALLRSRRSGRAYDATRLVSDQDLLALLEAARWAPSGGNVQPWRFVVGSKSTRDHDTLAKLLMEGNRIWAQYAPLLILTAAQVTRINTEGKQVQNSSALHDAGLANMSIAVEATHRQLMIHMMGGFNKDAARELLDTIEPGLEPVTIMSVGYAGDGVALPEDLQKRESAPRTRKVLDEILLKPGG